MLDRAAWRRALREVTFTIWRRPARAARLGAFALATIAGGFFLGGAHVALAVAAWCAVFFAAFPSFFAGAQIGRMVRSQPALLGPHRLRLREDGLEIANDAVSAFYLWKGFVDRRETRSFLLLFHTSEAAVPVPLSGLSEAERSWIATRTPQGRVR